MEGDVTYADLRFPLSEGSTARAESPPDVQKEQCKEKPAAKSTPWEWCTLLLGILCLLLLAVSIALGLMLLEKSESDAECSQNLTQTAAALIKTAEALQTWRMHAGLHWYCPKGWTLENRKCFHKSTEKTNRDTGLMDCVARGAFLAVPPKEQSEFFSNISESCWVGVLYRNSEFILFNATDFVYTSDRKKLWQGWISDTASNCVKYTVKDEFLWEYCGTSFHWICEKDALMIQFDEDHLPPALSTPSSNYTNIDRMTAESKRPVINETAT